MKEWGQSRSMAVVEALINIGSGMIIAFALSQLASIHETEIQQYIYKDFHWNVGIGSNMVMTAVLTFVSMLRSFAWRRVFNAFHLKTIKQKLKERK